MSKPDWFWRIQDAVYRARPQNSFATNWWGKRVVLMPMFLSKGKWEHHFNG